MEDLTVKAKVKVNLGVYYRRDGEIFAMVVFRLLILN